ncbi:hypothetical protein PVAP13_2KG478200 [Panicum virgatum]|uniref:F-box domain-containing protein n=1 Tax=Panicum virgatum TaxID=38727 RepID=A0A8T0WMV6_PANVG|nr:hypothetical protein PVAP13_2KG478200 [Panicum virgatum]KAG2645964.1 hypothetical protein PVAP13_2KG478200 [Panicum virgatum]
MAATSQEMAPSPQTAALTDDVLEEIFLRVASPADLARASTACISFRRLIASPTFLRRSSSASSIPHWEGSNQPRRPTPTLLPPALSPAPPPSPSTTSRAAEGAAGTLATSATVASSSTAALMPRKVSSSRSSRCATPCPGVTCFCLPYPRSCLPPYRLWPLGCQCIYKLGCSKLERMARHTAFLAQLCIWLLLLESTLEEERQARDVQ